MNFQNRHRVIRTAAGLFVLTAVSFMVTGYRYGIDDHIVHIPRLLHILDPGLYAPDDPFILAQRAHYSYFWHGVAVFARFLPLEGLFFILTFLLRFILAITVWRLSYRLFQHEGAAWLGTAALLVDKLTFGFFVQPDKSLLDRTAALPLVLFGLEQLLAGRRLLPYVVTGLVVNIHVLSALYTLPLLVVGDLYRDRMAGAALWVLLRLGCVAVLGLPIWWWRWHAPNGLSLLVVDPEWLAIAKAAIVTLLNLVVLNGPHLAAILSGLGFIAAFFVAQRALKDEWPHNVVRLWIVTAAALVMAAAVFTDFVPVGAVVMTQLVRVSYWLVLFPVLYFAHYLCRLFEEKRISLGAFLINCAVLVCSVFSFLPLIALAPSFLSSRLPWWAKGGARTGAQVAALALAGFYLFLKLQVWPYLFLAPTGDWKDVETWVRQNTDKQAVVLVPPYVSGGDFGSEFRVEAQRSVVVTYAEGGEVGFNQDFARAWFERMSALTNKTFSVMDPFENTRDSMKRGFDSLTDAQLSELAQRYRTSYVLVEAPRQLELPISFRNRTFTLYRVPPP